MDDERKIVRQRLEKSVSEWHSITGKFEAERYPGTPLLDTTVTLEVPPFSITWEDKDKLLIELAEVIKKYQI